MRTKFLLAVLLAAPMTGFAIWDLARTLDKLANPCVRWGQHANGTVYRGGEEANGCPGGIVRSSRTKTTAVLWLTAVVGGTLVAAGLAITGAALSKPTLTVIGGLMMIVEAVPTIFSLAPLALLTGIGYIALGVRQRRDLRRAENEHGSA